MVESLDKINMHIWPSFSHHLCDEIVHIHLSWSCARASSQNTIFENDWCAVQPSKTASKRSRTPVLKNGCDHAPPVSWLSEKSISSKEVSCDKDGTDPVSWLYEKSIDSKEVSCDKESGIDPVNMLPPMATSPRPGALNAGISVCSKRGEDHRDEVVDAPP